MKKQASIIVLLILVACFGCNRHKQNTTPALLSAPVSDVHAPSTGRTNMPVDWYVITDGKRYAALWPSGQAWDVRATKQEVIDESWEYVDFVERHQQEVFNMSPPKIKTVDFEPVTTNSPWRVLPP